MITSSTNELFDKCIVKIFVSGSEKGFGFFVAPNIVLTCFHVICVFNEDGSVYEIASDIEIYWGDQRLHVQDRTNIKIKKEVDLALLSVELTDHPCLPLKEDVVSFEPLNVYGHSAHIVKGFAGNAEKIMLFEAEGDDIEHGDSGAPLYNPRTKGICGLIQGEGSNSKEVKAIHIKSAKSFTELANRQDNLQNLSSNTTRVFIVYDKSDEASFNTLAQSLRELYLTNLALIWEYVDIMPWEIIDEPFPGLQQRHSLTAFETARIIVLLVSSNPDASDNYYRSYVQQTWERYNSGKIGAFQVLSLKGNLSPIEKWPGHSLAFEEFAKGLQEVIEALNSRPS